MMNAKTFELGMLAIHDCFNRKESVIDAVATFERTTASGNAAYYGAIHACITVIGAFLETGERLGGHFSDILNQYPSQTMLKIAHSTRIERNDATELAAWTDGIVLAAEAIRTQRVASIALVYATPDKAAALPVAVVSLPERETRTTVERDESGNIIATAQLEKDAVPELQSDAS